MEAEWAGDTGLMPKTLVLWFVLCFSQHFFLPMPFLNFYHVFVSPLTINLKIQLLRYFSVSQKNSAGEIH